LILIYLLAVMPRDLLARTTLASSEGGVASGAMTLTLIALPLITLRVTASASNSA